MILKSRLNHIIIGNILNIWKKFEKRIFIKKSTAEVYECWTTKSQLESWFLEKADFIIGNSNRKSDEPTRKGDSFIWKWNNWDIIEEGKILEANDKDTISFTFGPGGYVEVSLKEFDEFTEVTLIQDDIPTDDKSKMELYVGCNTGWTFWLTNLKAYLEHGITLHAKGLKQKDTNNLVNS